MSYQLTYAGRSNLNYGLLIVQRPNICAAEENVTVRDIPGRTESLTERSGQFGNVKVEVVFNYKRSPEEWARAYRNAVLWLRRKGELRLSDDPGVFRKVLYVQIGENERTFIKKGEFKASFVCAPGEYLDAGTRWISLRGDTLRNEWSMARPLYELTGQGTATLTVNGSTATVELNGVSILDTDRLLAYHADGSSADTSVSGDYDELVLQPGDNRVTVTGATLRIQPNWRVV